VIELRVQTDISRPRRAAHAPESEPQPPDVPGYANAKTANHAPGLAPLVLLVEDDRRMRKYLRTTLADQQLRVIETETGGEALAQAAAHNPELVLLDYGLPDIDGIQVTTKLRQWTAAPILILSVRDDEHDKIAALDAGANDFLIKPFGTGELLARIRVWLRHTQRAAADSLSSVLDVGPLQIDFGRRLAFVSGREVRLTPTQYKLFAMLMRNAGKVMTHEQILLGVWGPAYTRETQYLRVYMGQLRQKFEEEPARPRHFLTEPGVGYRLRAS
jgi:two-component system, OmpR family, KDP operon response regulator KdpE